MCALVRRMYLCPAANDPANGGGVFLTLVLGREEGEKERGDEEKKDKRENKIQTERRENPALKMTFTILIYKGTTGTETGTITLF